MPTPISFSVHDHRACMIQAIDQAKQLCAKRKLRLTAIRQQVLQLIWQSHKPIGAYDLLALINQQGGKAAPPTIYRALDFLLEHGLIHRLASVNAFIGCICPEHGHQGSFLICRQCHRAQEVTHPTLTSKLQKLAQAQGFAVESTILEVSGLCQACQREQA